MDENAKKTDHLKNRIVFAEQLRKVFDESEHTKKSIAQVTRINQEFVTAIIEGQFDLLPGKIFGRGFVKNICKAIRANEESFLELYSGCWPEEGGQSLSDVLSDSEKAAKFGKTVTAPKKIFSINKSLSVVLTAAAFTLVVSLVLIYVSRPSEFELSAESKKSEVTSIEQKIINENVAEDIIPEVKSDDSKVGAELDSEKAMSDKEQSANIVDSKSNNSKIAKSEADKKKLSEVVAKSEKQKKSDDLANEDEKTQNNLLKIIVKENVKIKKKIDQGKTEVTEMTPNTYSFEVNEMVELLIYDAASVEIEFNGRNLGNLGRKGRIRKLVFVKSDVDKL